jgi:adenylyltransferase/sulfurtransferase
MDERYSRQVLFAGIGAEGQERLARARALIVGCGALGSAQAQLLARAGVGHLRIVDRDFVEPSNLQRQLLFEEDDARRALPKAIAARGRIAAINSGIEVEPHVADVDAGNIAALARDCDVILDGGDNFEIRFLVNDLSVRDGIPWVYGAAVGSHGLMMPVLPGTTPCLRCVFEDAPPAGTSPTCDTAGVIGPIIGLVASLQAAEALKILAGRREAVTPGLVIADVWEGRLDRMEAGAGPSDACPACAKRRFDFLEGERGSRADVLCGRRSVQISPAVRGDVDLPALRARLEAFGEVVVNDFLLRARLGEQELTVFRDGRVIVGGTTDEALARSLVSRYVGL